MFLKANTLAYLPKALYVQKAALLCKHKTAMKIVSKHQHSSLFDRGLRMWNGVT
jgi:hypothetical protein